MARRAGGLALQLDMILILCLVASFLPSVIQADSGQKVLQNKSMFVVNAGDTIVDGNCISTKAFPDSENKNAPPSVSFGLGDEATCPDCYGVWDGQGSPNNKLPPNPWTACVLDGYNSGKAVSAVRGLCANGAWISFKKNWFQCISIHIPEGETHNVQVYKNGDCTKKLGEPYTTSGEFQLKSKGHCIEIT